MRAAAVAAAVAAALFGRCAAELAPFVVVAEPLPDAVVHGDAEGDGGGSASKNVRNVRVVVHYYDLPGGEGNAGLGLWIRADRGEASTLVEMRETILNASVKGARHQAGKDGLHNIRDPI